MVANLCAVAPGSNYGRRQPGLLIVGDAAVVHGVSRTETAPDFHSQLAARRLRGNESPVLTLVRNRFGVAGRHVGVRETVGGMFVIHNVSSLHASRLTKPEADPAGGLRL